MPRFGKKRIRRRQMRKLIWIVISMFATLALVAMTVAPGLSAAAA